ncbi:hypothetical protein [Parageobacillus thermoglucosidasius]|uniref:hypothetical protein n=1 Tax=Parageobacillus thermoglucosidasius TaxID=1426 RepID=UPI0001D170D9|nr:hypothetical protein [Parageobacillus thermoglucosidasius]AEH46777.1 hypothetical protein Geoth_0779 [Parageobacillus thermoglucosidasius C56-YS93]
MAYITIQNKKGDYLFDILENTHEKLFVIRDREGYIYKAFIEELSPGEMLRLCSYPDWEAFCREYRFGWEDISDWCECGDPNCHVARQKTGIGYCD